MASKAPPPLIRSTKAFSVEIPEGSNSAKARRSDVVGSDDLDIHQSASNFQSADQHRGSSKGFHEDQALDLGSAFGEDHAELAQGQVHDHHDALKDRFAADQAGHGHAANMVNEDHAHLDKVQGVATDAIHDNLQGIAYEAIHDNLQGVGNEGLHDNLQGVGNEAIHDNLQGLANEAIHDHVQGVGIDAEHDHQVGIPQSPEVSSQQAGLPKDAIHDNLQGILDEAIEDNVQGIPNEALNDHVQCLGVEAAHDNKAAVAKEPEQHNKAGVAKEGIQDNQAGIPKDSLQDNDQGIAKDHLDDHIVQLPSTQQVLKDGPKPGAPQTGGSLNRSSADHHSTSKVKRPSHSATSHAPHSPEEQAAHTQAALLAQQEKAKKMEEFHGRVDAIRKTVSGINHKLDELDEESTPLKH